MGWTVRYHLLRGRLLDEDERRLLIRRVRLQLWAAEIARDDGQVAFGDAEVVHGTQRGVQSLLGELTQLRQVSQSIVGLRCVVQDDLNIVGWDETRRAYALGGKPDGEPLPPPDIVCGWTMLS